VGSVDTVLTEWQFFRPVFSGVRLESPKKLRKLIVKTQVLDAAEIDRIARVLGAALPAK
jgi:hypothetical protein